MFIMDVPAVPAQETPIVLAQAATPAAGATPQPAYILQTCGETVSTGDPSSAMRTVDPAGMLRVFLQAKEGRRIEPSAVRNIAILQDTTHGKISSVIDNTGRPWYAYDAEPNYIGNDRAIFLAEFEGKVYRIVVELHVFRGGVPGDFGASTCPAPQLIKVTPPAKPSSGASGFGSGYDLSSISVTFADLPGAAVGQTTGSTITLDTNAADNSEFLPTSNPNEWVAKAGSAVEGKMDMLSVRPLLGNLKVA